MKKLLFLLLISFNLQTTDGQSLSLPAPIKKERELPRPIRKAPAPEKVVDFTIGFMGGFTGDTLSLKVNNEDILSNAIVQTNLSGSSDWSIYQDKEGLWEYHAGNKVKHDKVLIDSLVIEVKINKDVVVKRTLALDKGKYIYAYYYPPSLKLNIPRILSFHQEVRAIPFE